MNKVMVFILTLLLLSCNNPGKYQEACKLLHNSNMQTNKYLMLTFFARNNCISCSLPLKLALTDTSVRKFYGGNLFIVYPGLREIEERDNLNDLSEVANLRFKSINDISVYKKLKAMFNIADKFDNFIVVVAPDNRFMIAYIHDDPNFLLRMHHFFR